MIARRATIVLLFVLVSLSSKAWSTTIVPLSPNQLVHFADLIFAGTVTSVSSSWIDEHKTIVTRVKFSRPTFVKGTYSAPTVTLTFLGGKVGKDEVFGDETGPPQVGGRYVVLCSGDLGSEKNSYTPVIGLFQGHFEVRDQAGSGAVVHHWTGLPVLSMDDDTFVLRGFPHEPSGKPTTVAQYGPNDPRPHPREEAVIPRGQTPPQGIAKPRVTQGSPPSPPAAAGIRPQGKPWSVEPSEVCPVRIEQTPNPELQPLTESQFLDALKRMAEAQR